MSKDSIVLNDTKQNVKAEIRLLQLFNHRNIVEFIRAFSDKHNVYILLEFCANDSLKSLKYQRNVLTEFECRYYVYHILCGLHYLHKQRIIHRDLQLGNIFLAIVKIGDFGLTTQVQYPGQLKTSTCGTVNYLAPEIINRTGYSFAVDIWAIGVIMFFLLIGRGPFESNDANKTYEKIIMGKYV